MTSLVMCGYNKAYPVPRRLRGEVSQHEVPAWQLLALSASGGDSGKWADDTLESALSALSRPARETLECPDSDCEDIGFYATADPADDMLYRQLVRRVGEGSYEALTAAGAWEPWEGSDPLILLTMPDAVDLADALLAGAEGLALRCYTPQAWLAPSAFRHSGHQDLSLLASVNGDLTLPFADRARKWDGDAAVNRLFSRARKTDGSYDTGKLSQGFLYRDPDADPQTQAAWLLPFTDVVNGELQIVSAGLTAAAELLPSLQIPQTDQEKISSRISRMASPLSAAVDTVAEEDWTPFAVVDDLDPGAVIALIRLQPGPKVQRYDQKSWVDDPELLAQLEGVNPPPLVELDDPALSDVIAQIDGVTAAVSPDPRAEKLRRYWAEGKGAAKIKWGAPGDFKRCVHQLNKYMPGRAEGYCANLHKRVLGKWPGRGRNRGHAASAMSTEQALLSALVAGAWSDHHGRNVDMLKDGIYTEALDDVGLVRAVLAGGFPVAPPDEWFANPGLERLTPLTHDDSGRVFGHIADWHQAHIGLPGSVKPPRSRSNYSYFTTGTLRTASGKDVNVGQLTLAGGHAPLNADAGHAVAHYDNTASAVADVVVGEDKFGIWVAGALRPDIKPEQVRSLRASAPSGDWRPINGSLELVAVCQVNVPGFPIARARVASGAVTALVAAGARSLAVLKASMTADAAVLERLAAVETALFTEEPETAAVEAEPEQLPETDEVEIISPEAEPEAEQEEAEAEPAIPVEQPASEAVQRAREAAKQLRIQKLRDRVHPVTAAAGGDSGLPFADRGRSWDGAAAANRMFARAKKSDGTYDTGQLAQGFLYHDSKADPNNKGSWKLPIADVINGKLQIVYSGLAAAAAALKGARGGASIPQADRATIQSKINGLYSKAAKKFKDDEIVSPFK